MRRGDGRKKKSHKIGLGLEMEFVPVFGELLKFKDDKYLWALCEITQQSTAKANNPWMAGMFLVKLNHFLFNDIAFFILVG